LKEKHHKLKSEYQQLQQYLNKTTQDLQQYIKDYEISKRETIYWKECTTRLEITIQDQQQQKTLLQTLLQEERMKLLQYDTFYKESQYQQQIFCHYMESIVELKHFVKNMKKSSVFPSFSSFSSFALGGDQKHSSFTGSYFPPPPPKTSLPLNSSFVQQQSQQQSTTSCSLATSIGLPTNPPSYDDFDLLLQATKYAYFYSKLISFV